MNEFYAIVVKREKQVDYYWPVSLEIIDEYFTKYKRAGVLAMMRQNDSILTETNPETLSIKKIINGRLIEDKNTRIIEDPFVFHFSLEDLFKKIDKSSINRIHNHLIVYKSKNVSLNFKSAIDLLKEDKKLFLNIFSVLSYPEQRIIRTIINSNVDLYKMLGVETIKDGNISYGKLKQEPGEGFANHEDKLPHEPAIILERSQKNDKEEAL